MLTIRKDGPVTAEFLAKRSRFIAIVERTDTVEEARQVINGARHTYPDARHHCTAYIIRPDGLNPILHSSDDGEPAGTAGMPMLDVLKHSGIENVTAVVVRYFGGTLLGKGGLVRAYSSAVQQALALTHPVALEDFDRYRLSIPLRLGGKVEAELRASGWNILKTHWDGDLQIEVSAHPREKTTLLEQVAALTQSDVDYHLLGTIRTQVDRPSQWS